MPRLRRPFPMRALADGLYQVQATGNSIHHKLTNELIDLPYTAEHWVRGLQALNGLLMVREDECQRARAVVDGLYDRADEDSEAGLRVVTHMLRGLGFASDVPVSPEEDEALGEAA